MPVRFLLALGLVAMAVAGCSDEESSAPHALPPVSPGTESSLAAHTPSELRHPCRIVTAADAGNLLGVRVRAERADDPQTARTLDCRYVASQQSAPVLEIRSHPDTNPVGALVRLYVGVDRLRHHPVDVPGSDGAEAVLQPEDELLTMFVKQGFVTHTVVVRLADLDRGERVAAAVAAAVVDGNR